MVPDHAAGSASGVPVRHHPPKISPPPLWGAGGGEPERPARFPGVDACCCKARCERAGRFNHADKGTAPMDHFFDLNAHELARQAAVMAGCGDLYDLGEVAAGEAEARRRLWANLDPAQRAIRDELIAAGVLDP